MSALAMDTYEWLQAIADNPYLDDVDLVAAYGLLGVGTALSDDETFWGRYHLETEGFVHSTVVKRRSRLAKMAGLLDVVEYQLLEGPE